MKIRGHRALGWWLMATVWLGGAAGLVAAPIVQVKADHAEGGVLDESSVLAFCRAKPGDEFDPQVLTYDVRTLKETGRYSYVAAGIQQSDDGIIVVYTVHPRPVIKDLEISGADHFSTRKIRKLLDLSKGDPVDDVILGTQARKVEEEYRKRFYPEAKVTWSIEEQPERGEADVSVFVEEGKRVRVRGVRFTGRDSIAAWRLRREMQQKSVNLLSFITGRGIYNEEGVETDRNILKRMYLDEGFHDVAVRGPTITPSGKRNIRLQYEIEEGPQYRVGDVKVEGAEVFDSSQVDAAVGALDPGVIAKLDGIEAAEQRIRDLYGSRGYLRTSVVTVTEAERDQPVLNVVFRVREGTQSRIGEILISGNDRTKDKVIRRELTVFPGDLYNEVRIRQSERRLRNLGFFSFVGSRPVPTSEEHTYDVSLEVEEQRSGQFAVGAGFSSVDDIIGFVELSQGNFDIFKWPDFTGAGQKFRIRLQLGTQRRDWQISFTEPWFLDQRLSLGFDLFQHERRFLSDDYDQLNTGGSVGLTRSLGGPNRLGFTYSLEDIEVKNVADDASELIKQEEGSRIKSAGALAFTHDSRDNFFTPSRGNRSVLRGEYAGGIFGGETDLYQLSLRSSEYFPLWFDHVFNLRGEVAVVDTHSGAEGVPIFDRLFLGGGRTLRGFDFRDVGPKDETGEPIGGQSLVYGTAEYTMPLVEPVFFATFFDIGMVYEDAYEFELGELNSDVGVGLRFFLPGFPLQLDYAWPLETDEFNDDGGRFNFFIGYQL